MRLSWTDLLRIVGLVISLIGSGAARAQTPVDLQLVLAVDASGSVTAERFTLQRDGYAAAFRHPDVLRALRGGTVAITMIQWTGPRLQLVVVPWTLISNANGAEAFAQAIQSAPRQLFSGGTSISGAIDFSATLFAQSRWQAARRVIDVSGDGANTSGRPASDARDDAVAQGIVINGLPILAIEPYLDRHYESEVIGGPGAFLIPAESYEAFADAVRRKLILEISSGWSGRTFAGPTGGAR